MARRVKTPTLRKAAASRSPSGSTFRSSPVVWLALVIVAAGALVYANSLSGPFLFDDETSILGNPQIRQLWPLSVPLSPPRDTPVAGRPLVNLTFALNYAADGLDVAGYHVVNIAIHVLAALVLFGIVRRTLNNPLIAFFCALIWMLHPLQTEAVNYLTERTESLMGLFYLLTLYCSIRATSRPKPAPTTDQRWRPASAGSDTTDQKWGPASAGSEAKWGVAAVAACAAGMAAKESMVTAPLLVVLYDRIFVFASFRESFRARGRLYAGLAATWLVLAGLLSARPRTSVGFEGATSSWVYLVNQVEMITRYLWLTVWPRALVLDYGLPQPLALTDVWPQAVFVVALGLAALVALVRWPRVGFLAAAFFITLGPTSSIVPIQTEVGAERRMYLPLAALVVLAVVAVFRLTLRHGSGQATRNGTPYRGTLGTSGTVGLAVVCLLLATGTLLRNREYRSRLSIAQTIVDRWPSGRGYFLLGSELVAAGRNQEALVPFRESARDYPGAHFALGTELAAGKIQEAIVELDAFLRLLPSHVNAVPAHDLIGRAYVSAGNLDEALRHFDVVLTEERYPFRGEIQGFVDQIPGGEETVKSLMIPRRMLICAGKGLHRRAIAANMANAEGQTT